MSRVGCAFAAIAAWCAPLAGQTVGTIDVGGSIVEYDGFLVSGAAVFTPALRYEAPNFTLGAQGSWVVFESGNQIIQGAAAGAWLTPPRGKWRGEFSGSVGASKYADAAVYGHALGRARMHFHGNRAGGWVSGTTGRTFSELNSTPIEIAIGGWTVHDEFLFAGTVTRTWRSNDGFVDVVGAARWSASTVQFDAQAGVRPWAKGGDDVGQAQRGAYAELSALVPVNDRINVALSGGRYPADPVRGVLAATSFSVGLQLSFGTASAPVPTVSNALVRAARELESSEHASRARLEIAADGAMQALRVRVRGAASVQLIGDFTDWQPVALNKVGGDTWEIQLQVAPGVHRLNVRVDGGQWLVPLGSRLEETEFGGGVGVVVVP